MVGIPNGWAARPNKTKRHYYNHASSSLCGQEIMFKEGGDNDDEHKNNCSACKRLKKKLTSRNAL